MKILILILLIISSNLFAKNKIVISKNLMPLPKNCKSELLNPNLGADIYSIDCSNNFFSNLNTKIYENEIYRLNIFDDPEQNDQWALASIDFFSFLDTGINVDKTPLVAIIDTGIDFEHRDLKNQIAYNQNEVPNNGLDDDQNGYIDDYIGWNSLNNNPIPMDDHSHGTAIAGIINAQSNNQFGMIGLISKPRIIPIRFMSPEGGRTDSAIKAIDYAASRGAKIINISWGGSKKSEPLFEIMQRCQEKGILFVIAAGNEGSNNDLTPTYPANFELNNTLVVGAIDWRNSPTNFSNYGKKSVHLFAPGESILSSRLNHSFGYFSGTSFAAPIVSGAVALMWSLNEKWSVKEIKSFTLQNCKINNELLDKSLCRGTLNLPQN